MAFTKATHVQEKMALPSILKVSNRTKLTSIVKYQYLFEGFLIPRSFKFSYYIMYTEAL